MDIKSYILGYAKGKADGGSGDAAITDSRVKYVTFMYGANELIKYPVISGDTVRDPVAKGLIETPTKESTVSTVYTYGGWSLTDGGSPSASALKNVTEDRVVYAALTESVRKYTANFYDSATSELIESKQVAYGSQAYIDTTREGCAFLGWTPSDMTITGDTDFYGTWEEAYKLADFTWSRLSELAKAGNGNKFEIGDTKEITYNGVTRTVTLVGVNTDEVLVSGSTYSTNSMTFRLNFLCNNNGVVDEATAFENNVSTWYGRGSRCDQLDTNLLPKLSTDLQNVLRKTKEYYYDPTQKEIKTTLESPNVPKKLFVPTVSRLGYSRTEEGFVPYAYFADTNTESLKAKRKMTKQDGTAVDYWTSSNETNYAYLILASGYASRVQCVPSNFKSYYWSVYFNI